MNQTILNETINQTATLFGYAAPFTVNPILDIFLITLVTATFSTLVNKYLSDQVRIKALRKEMKTLQKKMREHLTKDPKKAQALQQEIMAKNLENMKHAMNPKIMLVTMVPLILVFSLVRTLYGHMGEFLNLGFTTFGWLGTYILFSLINSIIMKKLFDVA